MHTCSTRCTFTRSRANNSHCRWKRRCIILESFIAPTTRRQIVVRLYHKHAYFRARARCYFRCPGIETRWVSYSNVRQHYVTTRQLRYLRIRKRRLALTAQRCCEYVAFLYPLLELWKLPPGVRKIVDRLMDSLIKGGRKLIHFIRFVMIMQYDNYVYSNLWLIVQTCRLELEENFENYLIKLILDSRREDSICIDDRRNDVTIKPY